MENRDLQAINVKVEVEVEVKVKNAVFVPIEKGDYEAEKRYRRQWAVVRNFPVHNVYGIFAIIGAETPEKAKELNDFFWSNRKKELRALVNEYYPPLRVTSFSLGSHLEVSSLRATSDATYSGLPLPVKIQQRQH